MLTQAAIRVREVAQALLPVPVVAPRGRNHGRGTIYSRRVVRDAVYTVHSQEWLCYTSPAMTYYERNLPHWHPEGQKIFLTW